jgi:hypothetical protein
MKTLSPNKEMVLPTKETFVDLNMLAVPSYLCALIAMIIAIIFGLFVFEMI